jgi:hypothetical protein
MKNHYEHLYVYIFVYQVVFILGITIMVIYYNYTLP